MSGNQTWLFLSFPMFCAHTNWIQVCRIYGDSQLVHLVECTGLFMHVIGLGTWTRAHSSVKLWFSLSSCQKYLVTVGGFRAPGHSVSPALIYHFWCVSLQPDWLQFNKQGRTKLARMYLYFHSQCISQLLNPPASTPPSGPQTFPQQVQNAFKHTTHHRWSERKKEKKRVGTKEGWAEERRGFGFGATINSSAALHDSMELGQLYCWCTARDRLPPHLIHTWCHQPLIFFVTVTWPLITLFLKGTKWR